MLPGLTLKSWVTEMAKNPRKALNIMTIILLAPILKLNSEMFILNFYVRYQSFRNSVPCVMKKRQTSE